MEVINDNGCSWINDLNPRNNIDKLSSNLDCEWLIVGAGYTGLSAARKLGQLYPNQKIILVDAQLAGEGASSRNSGYLVDTIQHQSGFESGAATWDLLSKDGLEIAYGIYLYHIDAPGIGETTGKFAVIK